jgi:hypothetical protein
MNGHWWHQAVNAADMTATLPQEYVDLARQGAVDMGSIRVGGYLLFV